MDTRIRDAHRRHGAPQPEWMDAPAVKDLEFERLMDVYVPQVRIRFLPASALGALPVPVFRANFGR